MADETPEPLPQPRPARGRGRRIALGLGLGAAVAVLAGVLASQWVTRTEPGTAWLLARMPGLQVEGLRGSLSGGDLAATALHFEQAGQRLDLRGLQLTGLAWAWQLGREPGVPLLQVSLASASADEVRWQSAPSSASTPAPAPVSLRLPFALDVGALRAARVQVDELPALLDVQAALKLGDGDGARHRIDTASFRTDRVQARLSGQIGADGPLPLQLDGQLASLADAATAWQATLQLAGPLATPRAQAHLAGRDASGPALDAQATLKPFAAWPLAELNLTTRELDLAALHASAPRTRLRGQIQLQSTGMAAPAKAEATLANDAAGRWDEGRLPVRRLHLVAEGQLQSPDRLQFSTLAIELGGASASAGGQLRGSGSLQPAEGSLELQLKLALDALRPAALDQRLPAMTLGGPLEARVSGLPGWSAASTPTPGATWQALIDAKLEGRLDAPAPQPATTAAAATGPKAPPAAKSPATQLTLQLALGPGKVELRQALAQSGAATASLQGQFTSSGKSGWAWQAQGALKEFDPALWVPLAAAPGARGPNRLNATLATEGRLDGALPTTVSAWLTQLTGRATLQLQPSTWAGLPVQGELTAAHAAGSPATARLNADLAGNLLTASADGAAPGRPGQLQATLDAKALAVLAPWWDQPGADSVTAWLPRAGTLQAQASARWPEGNPATAPLSWQLQAQGAGLTHPSWHAERVDARAQGVGRGDDTLELSLSGTGLAHAESKVDTLQADLRGGLRQHTLTLQAESPVRPPIWVEQVLGAKTGSGTRLKLAAQGRWLAVEGRPGAGRWEGVLQELQGRARDGSGQPWLAARDLPLRVNWDADGRIERAWAEPGSLTLPGTTLRWSEASWQAGEGAALPQFAAKASIDAFELAPLLARAQPELGWRGDLVLGGEIKLRAGERFDADVVFERQRGDLSVADDVRDSATVQRALGLTDLRVGLSAHDGTWHFTTGLAGRQLGEMAGVASVHARPGARWPAANDPLDGVFQLHVAQLGAWGGWVPPGWRLGGDLTSAATLGGRWGAPEFSGKLVGRQLEVRNALEGVQLTQGEVEIQLRGDRAHIERFEWRGGDGRLTLTGDATLGREPSASLKLVAERFRVLGRIDRRLVASGDAQLSLSPTTARLTGALKVDEGLYDVSKGGAPSLDGDVRVVNDPASPSNGEAKASDAAKAGRNGLRTQIDLSLDLGQALRVKGRGLDTLLSGQLKLTNPGNRLAVNGEVRATRGTYAAYGQKLEIERGLLDFNGPVEDPRLDILAVRPNLDVTVGVAVTGSALNTRVRLISEPDMTDTDKLSWLVLGRAPDGLGRADTALLQRAAIALLVGEGEAPTDAFLSSIGLSDFGVRQTGEGTEQATVVSLGKQLSRRWYVGYERSVNATTGTWQLIYRIAQRFTLRAQSGDDNALDLVWTWRWN